MCGCWPNFICFAPSALSPSPPLCLSHTHTRTHILLPPPRTQDAEKEDYEEKLKEVQDVCGPVISKVYAAAGGEGGAGEEDDLGDHSEL